MSPWFLLLLLGVSRLAWIPAALAQSVPAGPQFQVNTYTTNAQYMPAATTGSAGGFVVLWSSAGSTGSDTSLRSIQGRRYDSAGTPLGGEFEVNSYTTNVQEAPAAASGSAGNFVVVWTSTGSTGSDASDTSIQGQRYDSAGALQGGEFQVNSYTTNAQYAAAVAANGPGDFVVVWTSIGSVGTDSSSFSIQGQRYSSVGIAQGSQFQVNTFTTSIQKLPAVASDSTGNFVVVWESLGSAGTDSSSYSIQGQRFNGAGAAQGSQFQVNSYTTGMQRYPGVTTDGAGNFVVVWQSTGSAGSDTGDYSIQAQRFNAAGAPLGVQFQVNTYATGGQYSPAASSDSTGNFVVLWSSDGSAGSDTIARSIQGQHFNSAGAAQGAQFQVNTFTTSGQYTPAVARGSSGNFVVAWGSFGSPGTDSSAYSVQGQRFGVPTTTSISTSSTSTSLPPVTELLPGKLTIIKPDALAKFVAKSAKGFAFALPSVDPSAVGATLRIFDSAATAGDDTYNLPAAGWKGLGNPPGAKGYKYKGAATVTDPCKSVLVKPKLIKAVCKNEGVTLTPPFAGNVSIVLGIGPGDEYCAQFGGDEVRNDATVTKRKKAPPPVGCP